MSSPQNPPPCRIPSQNIRSEAVPLPDILPTELWETIFHELSLADILRLGAVCTTFNALCTPILLRRARVSASGSYLSVSGDELLVLAALAPTPPVVWLTYHPRPERIEADLILLRNVVLRSEKLREIRLSFCHELSAPSVLPAFLAVLSSMAARAPGPVVVFSFSDIFSCWPQDIAAWHLDFQSHVQVWRRSNRRPGLLKRLLDLLRVQRAESYTTIDNHIRLHTEEPNNECNSPEKMHVRLHTRETTAVHGITSLRSVRIYTCSSDEQDAFTLLTFDVDHTSHLWLGPGGVPAVTLSAAIAAVRLPSLRRVHVSLAGIVPAALGSLLWNHSGVTELTYRGTDDDDEVLQLDSTTSENKREQNPLISPALAHIGLTYIETSGSSAAGRIIPVLAACPRLFHFALAIPRRPSPTHAAGIILDLQAIAGRGEQCATTTGTWLDLTLLATSCAIDLDNSDKKFKLNSESTTSKFKLKSKLNLDSEADAPFFLSPAALALAPTLSCVHKLEFACGSVCAAEEMLPWLALLPHLQEVRFEIRAPESMCRRWTMPMRREKAMPMPIHRRRDPRANTPEVDAFAEKARAVLRGVGHLSASSDYPEWD
ncbi:hypothetical protein C8R43DRAFT_1170477 [Mycena crocata]|nr:hypothetical protein C8R43DRAFT_1170477 [Mycena crocata]